MSQLTTSCQYSGAEVTGSNIAARGELSGAPMPLPTQNTGWVPRALGDERAPKRFLGSHPAVLRAIPAAGVRKKRIDDKDMRKVWNPEDN